MLTVKDAKAMTVPKLKAALVEAGLPTNGLKAQLLSRLLEHIEKSDEGKRCFSLLRCWLFFIFISVDEVVDATAVPAEASAPESPAAGASSPSPVSAHVSPGI